MGKLLVIEGLDGSGKATQTRLLCERLMLAGHSYRRLSFPDYGKPYAEPVRMYLAGEFGSLEEVGAYGASLFFAVDRYASFLAHWKKDYEAGTLIVADRYATSNVVHQMSKLPQAQWDDYLRWQQELEYDRVGIPRPDRVLYLDMDPEVSRRLLSGRYHGDESKRDIHEADFGYLLHCREAALYGARALGWEILPCSGPEDPFDPEAIARKVWAAAAPLLEEDSGAGL